MSEPSGKSPSAIEADIEAARARLATTIDELAVRAQPKEIARRQAQSAKARFDGFTRTPEGDLRAERVGALAAVAVMLVGLVVFVRRRG